MHRTEKCAGRRPGTAVIVLCLAAVLLLAFLCLLTGSSRMSVKECLLALRGSGDAAAVRIVRQIRLPRVLAAVIAGAGLSLSGLIMQTVLSNPMASPATLGVSNAAVFGADLSLLVFSGGSFVTGSRLYPDMSVKEPFAVSLLAFLFAALSVLLILGLCRLRSFSPGVVVLAGIAMGSVWTAAANILQYYATDVGLSAAVLWSFGDLGRATYQTDWIMLVPVTAGLLFFMTVRWHLNALLSGDAEARSLGVNVSRLRFFALLLSSLITAVCVSFLGVIGFVGIICPHIAKRLAGQDHRFSIPLSVLLGSLLLLVSDLLSRTLGRGASLPVGALTALFGAPFFIWIIFRRKEDCEC